MEILTASFQVIFEKIVDYTIGAVGRQMGYLICYKKNVDNLRSEVVDLKVAKNSVQQKVEAAQKNVEEIEDEVQGWLTSVEEITIKAQKFFEEEGQVKLKCCNGRCFNLKTRYQLGRRAHKLELAVKDIKGKGTFKTVGHRVPIPGGTSISTKGYEDFESRKLIFDGVMKALTDDNIRAIGVCGMGGLGKTMLVGKIAKQAIEDKLFERVVTVVVSQTPNLKQIQKDIAKELELKFQDEDTDFQKAHLLCERLKKEKILLIMDDIWNKIDLEAHGISFGDDHKGSKLLLTSRFRDVLGTDMDAQEIFSVGVLSNDEAKYLFSKIVGDLAENLNFQSTMVELVKECAGLPIAITTVANALKNQKKPNVWKDALRQLKRANPTHIKGMHDKVYQGIKLSYNFLPKEAQSLFLFCSLFEEDMVIPIALLWRILVGLDFFQDVYTMEEVRNMVHTLVESLKDSCLLLEGDGSGTFKMHDVIRDVAIYIADKDKEMLTIRSSNDSEKWSNMKNLKDSIGIALFDVKFSDLPKRLECPQLNFILLGDKGNSSAIPNHFFEGTKELKVLVLFEACLSLPSSLSCLHNLQSLVLNKCELEDVAIIGELKNLKALILSGSNIKRLPIEIGQLTYLQLLDLKRCTELEVIPPSVLSNLKRLEELYMKSSFNQWQVDGESTERNNARVSELDHLSLLTTLCIHIPNAKILPKALLFEKLERYEILIGNDWKWDRESDSVDEFKFSKMMKLELDRRFQAEDGIIILLKRCEYLDLAPKDGIKNIIYEVDKEGFPQLKHLYVRNSAEIQYIINLMGVQCVVFPLLEFLSLDNMINLEKICHDHDQLAMGSFHSLKKLEVSNCDGLIFVFSLTILGCFSQLQEIVIENCKVMRAIVAKERKHEIQVDNITDDIKTNTMDFSQLRSLTLRNLPNLMGFYSDVDSQLLFNEKVAFSNLEKIYIEGLDNLKMLWHNQVDPDSFCKLQILHVYNCENLMNIFPPNMLRRLQNLKNLRKSGCNYVEEVFEVRGANVDEICDKGSTQLRNLTLINLPKLKHVWTSDLEAILTFQNLHRVQVFQCKTLKSLFPLSVAKSLKQLESLTIYDCGLMEEIVALEEGLETMTKFVFPRINFLSLELLPKLKCFYPGKHTSEWPSLKILTIRKCNKVKTVALNELSFPNTNELGHHVSIQQPLFLIEKDTFPNLKELDLDWNETMNQTNGRLFGEFFCKLEVLSLYGKDDKLIAVPSVFVEGLRYLKSLSVTNLFFDNEGQYAGTFERLTELYLYKMPKLMLLWKENSEQGRAFQNLEILKVSECGRLKNLFPSSMHFRNLNILRVWKCHGLISLATSSTVKSLVQLKELDLYGCKRM
ncbi:probable disease resistance protein At4g27220 [Quercus lobata]|uniref:probable disease resistance protein At4g27220 n=1 Tax=Quercus lobata TaxID=97700 RepID=UPI0012480874|nr:probable disease resistance protein At4g27220 [Quercus lobata]XP_030959736.1 probable disease resistance protein At4g27220 [Quercus lobata]